MNSNHKPLLYCPSHLTHLNYIAGIDETGRGSFMGPVVSCAIILKREFTHPLINDSKKLSKKDRELLVPIIKENALTYWYIRGVVNSHAAFAAEEITMLDTGESILCV